MTLGEALKQYRRDNGFSQADVAITLGVSPMTISRLESDQPIRINRELSERIKEFLGEDLLDRVDTTTRNLSVVKREALYGGKPSPEEIRKIEKGCLEALKTIFSDSGVSVFENDKRKFGDFVCSYEKKNWLLEIKVPSTFRKSALCDIAMAIGCAAMEPSINKVSVVWCTDSAPSFRDLPSIQTYKNLNFDVSLVHYNLIESRFDFELEISSHFDGTGFFDIAVSDRAPNAAKLYAKWKNSLS